MLKYSLLFLLAISCGAKAQEQSFMPENNLHFYDSFSAANITEAQFNQIISDAERIYSPIIAGFGAQLSIQRAWKDSTVNAYASRQGNVWLVKMFGGMARRPEMTADGFRLVLCHELGHHIAGFPFYQGNWAANEGQSDYYSVHACFRKMVSSVGDPLGYVEPKVTSNCNYFWKNSVNRYICKRAMMGGVSLANLLGVLGGTSVSINTKDTSQVSKTSDAHPAAQCRLDTYVAGSLCKNSWEDGIIPETVQESPSCPNRPRCWYAP